LRLGSLSIAISNKPYCMNPARQASRAISTVDGERPLGGQPAPAAGPMARLRARKSKQRKKLAAVHAAGIGDVG